MIRIIAGEFRHRQINQPASPLVRPTQDRVREAVFSALGPLTGLEAALDLFAGSGAFGFESLSRGVKRATFVDALPASITAIRRTGQELQISNRLELIGADYLAALQQLSGRQFDLIFFDPPYKLDVAAKILEEILALQLLKPNGRAVAETPGLPVEHPAYTVRNKRYGIRYIGIYRRTI